MLLLSTFLSAAKTPKLYRCLQDSGNVVVQDRRCAVTQLQQAKPPVKNTTKKNKLTHPNTSVVKRRQQSSKQPQSIQSRSPYFVFGWDRILPANWQLLKEEVGSTEHLLLSKSRFNDSSDFVAGIKLSVYPKTMRSSSQGAFSMALALYHEIRERHHNRLIDSQFKSHDRFKVFNIGYRLPESMTALTEFYIDESNNDLFVLTIQSSQLNWTLHQRLADRIINNL